MVCYTNHSLHNKHQMNYYINLHQSQIYTGKQLLHNRPQIFLDLSVIHLTKICDQEYADSAFVLEVRLATPLINCQALMRQPKSKYTVTGICQELDKFLLHAKSLLWSLKNWSSNPKNRESMKRCPIK